MDGYEERLESLRARLAALERVAVAFSGGVDSSALGAVAVIADSPSLPRRELELARETARAIGATLVVIPTDEMEDASYRANRGDPAQSAARVPRRRAICGCDRRRHRVPPAE